MEAEPECVSVEAIDAHATALDYIRPGVIRTGYAAAASDDYMAYIASGDNAWADAACASFGAFERQNRTAAESRSAKSNGACQYAFTSHGRTLSLTHG